MSIYVVLAVALGLSAGLVFPWRLAAALVGVAAFATAVLMGRAATAEGEFSSLIWAILFVISSCAVAAGAGLRAMYRRSR